jgi:hypothetical protein
MNDSEFQHFVNLRLCTGCRAMRRWQSDSRDIATRSVSERMPWRNAKC